MSELKTESTDTKKKKGVRIGKGLLVWGAVLVAVLAVRLSGLLTVNIVSGESMVPTYGNNDIVIGSALPIWTGNLERGDIVTAKTDEYEIIKRVVGLPGETIRISEGKVYINDEELTEEYLGEDYQDLTTYEEDFVLGEGQYFIMGDNRNNSKDSRFYGPFSVEDLRSEVLIRIPLSEM